jgi:hypothetical protein
VTPAVVRAWLVSRAAVVALLALATYLQVRHGYGRAPVREGATGFLVWDGGWYRDIAAYGYRANGEEALRFFPLVPMLARLAAPFGAVAAGVLLVLVANVSALAYGEGLVRLTRLDLPAVSASRVAWLALLNPVAFVLVIGYAEATAAALAVWCLLALRRSAWWAAAGLAFLCGLARPVGLLLALPALVEAWRARSALVPRLAAVAAAPLGCAAYLGWVGLAYGDPLLPFTVQGNADLRGSPLAFPLTALGRAAGQVWGGRVVVALHLVWVPLVLWLLWLVARRLPASYAAYSAAIVFLAVTTPDLASFERYALSAFPLLMVAASTRSRHLSVTLGAACGLGLVGYSILAFASLYVP